MKAILFFIVLYNICSAQHPDSYWIPQQSLPANNDYRFEDMFFFDDTTGCGIGFYGEVKLFHGSDTVMIPVNDSANVRLNGTRCVSFLNRQLGFVGTLNHLKPLLKTTDGGFTWTPVTLPSPIPSGICGMSMVNENVLYGCGAFDVGFVSAPTGAVPVVIKTTDTGKTFTTIDMSPYAKSLVDCKFFTQEVGLVTGTVDSTHFRNGHAVVLITTDGGLTWKTVYKSTRIGEQGWKIFFRTTTEGYVALQSPLTSGNKYILKTTDGGQTWKEMYLGFASLRSFPQGVCFVDEKNGIAGGYGDSVFTTSNGGATWLLSKSANIKHMNRSRKINDSTYYVIASRVLKFQYPNTTNVKDSETPALPYPLPAQDYVYVPIPFEGLCNATIVDEEGRVIQEYLADNYIKISTTTLADGVYYVRIQSKFGNATRRFVVQK